MPLARISLTLSRHFSLSFIASGRSSGLHPVSSHSCCMYVRAGRPAFAWPYAGVHRSTSLLSSSLLLQQCPTCLVCLILISDDFWSYFQNVTSSLWSLQKEEVMWACPVSAQKETLCFINQLLLLSIGLEGDSSDLCH